LPKVAHAAKRADSPVLAVPAGRWSAFLRGVAGGDFVG